MSVQLSSKPKTQSQPTAAGSSVPRPPDREPVWQPSAADVARPRGCIHLSPREREIARMIALGYSNKIIADVLEISLWTVGTHLRRMFAKFGVTSRAAMVALAISSGILEAPAVPELNERRLR